MSKYRVVLKPKKYSTDFSWWYVEKRIWGFYWCSVAFFPTKEEALENAKERQQCVAVFVD